VKLARILLALVAAVATLAAVADARANGFRAAAPVEALAKTGLEVAYADEYGRGCHEVRVWSVADRGVRRYASHCFASTSTGSGIARAVVAGGRALWLTYVGGNTREWTLWTKSRTSGARRLQFAARDVDLPSPIVLGASERHVVYALGTTVVGLAPNGARAFAWTAPQAVVAITGSPSGYALQLDDGDVAVLSAQGRHTRTHGFAAGEVRAAVVLPGNELLVQSAAGFVRDGVTHAVAKGARFLGYSGSVVAYGYGAQLRLLRLSDDRTVVYRTLAPRFHADLDRRGLGYASGRTLGFDTWAAVTAALDR
jgi:hypothetical protein